MNDKPSRNEEEYFAKQEAELRKKRQAESQRASVEAELKAHYMKCPKCGNDLKTERYHELEVDRCTNCAGVWFDAGEVEQLVDEGHEGILGNVFGAVIRGVRGKKASQAE